ncbi:hypothetical protein 2 [Sanxia sobemo-like virus 1]|uniref:hypothetical protein 2 n=1 Tax=Sanxia sobemo-like virus 1 TaxID=1923380 RepID=UPI00090C8EF6|nr:hypothetical protein 2 [Sanxia sobemo-like virus 1]APG75866.1 hypothetical protein 2 [Sanxia sobemo-like virus 1]
MTTKVSRPDQSSSAQNLLNVKLESLSPTDPPVLQDSVIAQTFSSRLNMLLMSPVNTILLAVPDTDTFLIQMISHVFSLAILSALFYPPTFGALSVWLTASRSRKLMTVCLLLFRALKRHQQVLCRLLTTSFTMNTQARPFQDFLVPRTCKQIALRECILALGPLILAFQSRLLICCLIIPIWILMTWIISKEKAISEDRRKQIERLLMIRTLTT